MPGKTKTRLSATVPEETVEQLDRVAEERENNRSQTVEEVVDEWARYRAEFGPVEEAYKTPGDWLIIAQNAATLIGATLAVATVLAFALVSLFGAASVVTTVLMGFLGVLSFLFISTSLLARVARLTYNDWWDRDDVRRPGRSR